MIVDIIIALMVIIALVVGWRKGFIVQLLQLAGIYIAILVAPDFAEEVGEYFSQDPGLAYIIGFGIIILCVWIFVWIIAPIFRKILFFDFLKKIDSLLGMSLAVVATCLIASVACSLFTSANIGKMRAEKVLELGSRGGITPESIEEYAEMLENKDARVREYFEPKYVDYKILDESILFNKFAAFGEVVCPELKEIEEDVLEWAISVKSNYESVY
jgi:uncharacterized membrane protein required for colicin V production